MHVSHCSVQDVNDVIEEMQRAIFERQGVAGAWGMACLGRINQEYKGDAELLSVFYAFVAKSVPSPPPRCRPRPPFCCEFERGCSG